MKAKVRIVLVIMFPSWMIGSSGIEMCKVIVLNTARRRPSSRPRTGRRSVVTRAAGETANTRSNFLTARVESYFSIPSRLAAGADGAFSASEQKQSICRVSPEGARNKDQAQGSGRGTGEGGEAPRGGRADTTGAAPSGGNVTREQRTQIKQRLGSVSEARVTNVNFTVSVGAVVPTSVRFHRLPPEIVELVPAYR